MGVSLCTHIVSALIKTSEPSYATTFFWKEINFACLSAFIGSTIRALFKFLFLRLPSFSYVLSAKASLIGFKPIFRMTDTIEDSARHIIGNSGLIVFTTLQIIFARSLFLAALL